LLWRDNTCTPLWQAATSCVPPLLGRMMVSAWQMLGRGRVPCSRSWYLRSHRSQLRVKGITEGIILGKWVVQNTSAAASEGLASSFVRQEQ